MRFSPPMVMMRPMILMMLDSERITSSAVAGTSPPQSRAASRIA